MVWTTLLFNRFLQSGVKKMKTEQEKKDDNDVIIENKTKNTSNMFDLVQEICGLSENKIIQSDENSITLEKCKQSYNTIGEMIQLYLRLYLIGLKKVLSDAISIKER